VICYKVYLLKQQDYTLNYNNGAKALFYIMEQAKKHAENLIEKLHTKLYGTVDLAMCDEPTELICDEVIDNLKYLKFKEGIFLNNKTIEFIDSSIEYYKEVKNQIKTLPKTKLNK
jgi:hypothetical protein